MADNFVITEGVGRTMAADDIGSGILAQRVKIVWGADGTGTETTQSAGVPVQPVAGNSGGATGYKNNDLKATTGSSIQGSVTTLYSITVTNVGSAIRYIKLYNKATAPTSADTPIHTIPIPNALGPQTISFGPVGEAYSLGLGARASTGLADNDNVDPSANDVVFNAVYK